MALLLTGLLLPRSVAAEPTQVGVLARIFHEILFLSGPLEILLNFLLFVPFFLALLYLIPGLSRVGAAFISCFASAAAEITQSQIMGRVSSLRDFMSNCLGVVFSCIAISLMSKRDEFR
jgi:glycopeptide antibiotics resistance protein